MMQNAKSSPLADPQALPLRSVQQIAADSVLVVAPHPDDETLGCGGAIALLCAQGCRVRILVVSDGTQSHPNSRHYPAAKLRALRESETRSAMAILGVDAADIEFLGLADGSVPMMPSDASVPADFSAAVQACCNSLKTWQPTLIFLPWRSDPHLDHRATWQLIHAAVQRLELSVRLVEYPIWDWDPEQRRDSSDQERVSAWRLDIDSVVQLKQEAIAAYRSQTTDLIDDDPHGFQLTAAMLANFSHPWEVYLEDIT
jgi:LmbE family N-acetylglucosaminyl deacetylase